MLHLVGIRLPDGGLGSHFDEVVLVLHGRPYQGLVIGVRDLRESGDSAMVPIAAMAVHSKILNPNIPRP